MQSINIAILTCENYNCKDANGVEREQERTLNVRDLSHVNYNPEYSEKNVILEHDSMADNYKTFRTYVSAYKEHEGVIGRFNIDTVSDRNATKVLSCFVMSGSHDLIASMTRSEQVDYFKSGLEFLKEEYPSFHVVDSRVHFDEQGLPHMHTSMLPIHIKEDGSKTFNVTQHQKGRDYFKGFQDRFYEHMKERFPEKELERTDPKSNHDKKMSVKEYKDNQDMKRTLEQERTHLLEKSERLQSIEEQMNNRFDELKKSDNYLNKIDQYCKTNGMTIYQYEKQCFYAERGDTDYPEPERYNPEREKEHIHEKSERLLERER